MPLIRLPLHNLLRTAFLLPALCCGAAETPIVLGAGERLPPRLNPDNIAVSRDGRRYAYIRRTVNSLVPMIDGKPQSPADWIAHNLILFSDDSRHAFYIARGRNHATAVLDGKAGPPFESIDDWLLSPGGRLMYLARRKGFSVIVCDDAELAVLGRARLGALGEAADAVAFVEMTDTSERLYHRGRAGPVFQRIGEARFSPDGKRLAYSAMRDGRWHIVVDGEAAAAFDRVSAPMFSADSGHVAWAAERDGAVVVVLDGRETPLGAVGEPTLAALSANGRGWIATVRRETTTEVFSPSGRLGAFAAVLMPRISPDGARSAFVIVSGPGKCAVVLDGRTLPAGNHAFDLQFDATGRRFGHVTTTGDKDTLWIDGAAVGVFNSVVPQTLAFGPDGRTFAAVVRDGTGQRIVHQDGITRSFDAVVAGRPLSIASDGILRAFVVLEGELRPLTINLGRSGR